MKPNASSRPSPGELRRWKNKETTDSKRYILITRISTAPKISQSLTWSSKEENACYYIDSGGEEQWHYIEVITYRTEVVSNDEFGTPKTTS